MTDVSLWSRCLRALMLPVYVPYLYFEEGLTWSAAFRFFHLWVWEMVEWKAEDE